MFSKYIYPPKSNPYPNKTIAAGNNVKGCEHSQVGNYKVALDFFYEALCWDSREPSYMFNVGLMLNNLGAHREAIPFLTSACREKPFDFNAYDNLGDAYFNLGKYKEALETYRLAANIDEQKNPESRRYRPFHQMGNCYKELKEHKNAIDHFQKAAELVSKEQASEKANSYNEIGRCYITMKLYAEAILWFKQGIKVNKKPAYLYTNIGLCRYQLGLNATVLAEKEKQFKKAEKRYLEALKHENCDIPDIYNRLGLIHFAQNNYSTAIDYYDRALAYKEATSIYINKIDALIAMRRYEDALVCCDLAIKFDPRNEDLHLKKGLILVDKLNRYEAAIECYNKLLKFAPKNNLALNNKGYALYMLKDYSQALKYFDLVLSIDKNDTYAIDYKKKVQIELDKLSPAKPSTATPLIPAPSTLRTSISRVTIPRDEIKTPSYPSATPTLAPPALPTLRASISGVTIPRDEIKTPSYPSMASATASCVINFDELKLGKKIGKGGFGIVYAGTWRSTTVAVKQLLNPKPSDQAIKELKSEVSIMIGLQANIADSDLSTVKVHGYCVSPYYCLVMEYLPNGALFDVLHDLTNRDKPLDATTQYRIIKDMINGLALLHQKNIFHRDLKSPNVLLDHNYRAKLADFGLSAMKEEAKKCSTSAAAAIGTPAWQAPELGTPGARFTEAADVYSLGVTCWEVVTRKIPSPDEIGERNGKIPSDCSPKIASLIKFSWLTNPRQRPSAADLARFLDSGKQSFEEFRASTVSIQYRGNLNSM